MLRMRSEPMKIVLERRVRPGAEPAFERWVQRLVEAASRSRGFEGASVMAAVQSGEHFILLRFATQSDLDHWRASPEVIGHLVEGDALSEAAQGRPLVRTGLVTWVALLPQVILLAYLIPAAVPFLANAAISTAIPVVALTWFVMPGITRLLYGWLYAARVAKHLSG